LKRLLAVLALVAAMVAASVTAAWAASGTSLGSGQITVENTWMYQDVQFSPNTSRTLDLDCPSGKKVVTGSGVWIVVSDGSSSTVAGSALDSDTWEVTFSYAGSQTLRSFLQVYATCI